MSVYFIADLSYYSDIARLEASPQRSKSEGSPDKESKSQLENDNLKKEIEKLNKELKALAKENKEKKAVIDGQQQEIALLKDKAKQSVGSSTKSSSGDSAQDADLKKKLKEMEAEKQEDELIENEIYCMASKFSKDSVHTG